MRYFINVEPNVKLCITDINPSASKTILFIHGWPLDSKVYEYQMNVIPQKGYRCILVDIRGFGDSDKPIYGYDYDRLADDIRIVIEVLKLSDITLAGFSVGGAIAIRYMARHNSYGVSKLALFGAAAPSYTSLPDFPYGHSKEETNAIIQELYNDRPDSLAKFSSLFFYRKISESFLDWFLSLAFKASGYATIYLLISLRDENLFNDLKSISVPTLILHGKHDKICPFELARTLNTDISNSTLIPLEESGHGLFFEQSETFNNELLDFLA